MSPAKLPRGRPAHKRVHRVATLRDPRLVARWLERVAATSDRVAISRECALWLAEQLRRLTELERRAA
jgi:truncated hemoglobin YjbI